ncbi:hypothetical protein LPBF_06350 [Flavobacterium crassostreae]|uniref:Glycosyl transferase family 1 domain-containing protein n=2 Tax=Flavobacterium crassostreae TaxID=1763534 RepID=A0A1B9E3N5_9FLAO|nr:hypothetical protein LPBF_06350 [Flavobacterium crassostreae]
MSYLHSYDSDFLKVDHITIHRVKTKPSLGLKILNAIYRRIFIKSLYKTFVINQYKKPITKIHPEEYDLVFVRSSGLDYETILALKGTRLLAKAIINFHDPYPLIFDASGSKPLTKKDLIDWKQMYKIVQKAYKCMTPSALLSKDLQLIYGSQKKFYTLPHQYDPSVFNLTNTTQVRKKQKPISISYHGGLQFGRNVDIVLDAYVNLLKTYPQILVQSEFVLRLKSAENTRIKQKYKAFENIHILDTLDFSNSANEQMAQADILIILESTSDYSNILLGKTPFIASLSKPVLALLPRDCELRSIIKDNRYLARSTNQKDIESKLKALIENTLYNKEKTNVFGDYFGEQHFQKKIKDMLSIN